MLIINLKTEQRAHNYSLLSDRLLQEIKSALQQGGKIVLFYNRKGYARRIACKDCGHLFDCYDCKRSLVAMHHDLQTAFLCIYCKAKIQLSTCPTCKGTDLKFLGFGLERIKQELEKYTEHPVAIDSKNQNLQTINYRLQTTHDITLATQIPALRSQMSSAEGQLLQLAALLNADTDLYLPDFTAAVKTFNHIIAFKKFCSEIGVQHAIVQTYAPRHYAIYYGVRSNFESFLKKELQERKKYNYPPYSQLVKLIYQHKDQSMCKKEAQKMYDTIRKLKIENSEISLSPPSPAFVPKVRGNWRWQMVIKMQKSKIKNQNNAVKIKNFLRTLPQSWLIDTDPISLL